MLINRLIFLTCLLLTIYIATCSFTTCIQLSNIKSFDLLLSKIKPSLFQEGFISLTVARPILSDRIKMQSSHRVVANFLIKLVEMTGIEPATP